MVWNTTTLMAVQHYTWVGYSTLQAR